MRKNPSTSQTVLRVALAGNPNSGKTTLFNALTGTQQRVGNYPGVTVEKVEGTCRLSGSEIRFIDLPGTYNLSSCLPEEEVARAYLFEEAPDVIVDVVDAANLERNLYLTLRLLEMGIPLVIALNMSDKAESQGLKINGEELSRRLGGVPVVRTIASQSVGKEELLRAVEEASRKGASGFVLNYGEEVESALGELSRELETSRPDVKPIPGRWLLLNLLEGDSQARKWLGDAELLKRAETVSTELARMWQKRESSWPSSVSGDFGDLQLGHPEPEVQKSWTTRLDGILTCRRWGLPIFLALMYLVFTVTFTLGEPIMDGLKMVSGGSGIIFRRSGLRVPKSFQESAIGWRAGRCGRRLGISAEHRPPVSGDIDSGRYGLHGAGGVFIGQRDEPLRAAWEELYSALDRVRVYGSGGDIDTDYREQGGPVRDDYGAAAIQLWGKAADLRFNYPGVFPGGVAGAHIVAGVLHRDCAGRGGGQGIGFEFIQGQGESLRDGTAAISAADVIFALYDDLAPLLALFEEGGHGDSDDVGAALGGGTMARAQGGREGEFRGTDCGGRGLGAGGGSFEETLSEIERTRPASLKASLAGRGQAP